MGRLMVLAATVFVTGCASMNAHNHNQIGLTHFRSGRYELALREFRSGAYLDPSNADVLYNLGSAYHRLDQSPEAEAHYQHCLAIAPAHSKCRHALVVLLLEQSRSDEAYAMVDDWRHTDLASPNPLIELAWLEAQMGNEPEQLDALQQALAIAPEHPRALTELAEVYARGGRRERAIALYQRAMAANPNHPEIRRRIVALQDPAGTDEVRAMAERMPGSVRDLRYQDRY